MRDDLLTIAEVLQRHKYATAAFQVNPHLSSQMNFDQGFDLYKDDMPFYDAERLNSEVGTWIDAQEDKYFVYIHYMDVHLPYREHKQYAHLYGEREIGLSGKSLGFIRKANLTDIDKQYLENLYDGEIRYVDQQIGQLLKRFDRNTIIIITSDHGEEFWDHGGDLPPQPSPLSMLGLRAYFR